MNEIAYVRSDHHVANALPFLPRVRCVSALFSPSAVVVSILFAAMFIFISVSNAQSVSQCVCVCLCYCGSRFFSSQFIGKRMRGGRKNGKMSSRHSSPCRAHDENEQLFYMALRLIYAWITTTATTTMLNPACIHNCNCIRGRNKKKYHRTESLAAWLHMCVGWMVEYYYFSALVYRGQESWCDKERETEQRHRM